LKIKPIHKEHAILVRKNSDIKTAKDLENKSIALNTRRNIDELFVRCYLSHNGVNPSTVNFLEVPFPRMESVLLAGDVDAIAAIEPFVTFALQHEKVRVVDYNYVELEEKIEISSYDTLKKWIDENPVVAGQPSWTVILWFVQITFVTRSLLNGRIIRV
jgi:NitT/TauT family transport system substrate-binding protein